MVLLAWSMAGLRLENLLIELGGFDFGQHLARFDVVADIQLSGS